MNASHVEALIPLSDAADVVAADGVDMSDVGLGWRSGHEAALLDATPSLGFIEVHSENFMVAGGAALGLLLRARASYPVSLHGVGLALGSAAGLDPWHLDQLADLVDRVQPVRVSDHACFARAATIPGGPVWHGSDLLPIGFNAASLALMVRHVQEVQERLRRPLLVENLASYLQRTDDSLSEPEFFNQLARQTGCQLLLDVNNLVVNAWNEGLADPVAAACVWIDALRPDVVGEIHLAGHRLPSRAGALVIDDHSAAVPDTVWAVYRHAVARLGPLPSLVEWDTDVPPFETLLAQARQAAHWLSHDQATWPAHGQARSQAQGQALGQTPGPTPATGPVCAASAAPAVAR